jgi:hypothetical protein
MAARLTQMVRALQLAAVGAFVECLGLQRVMRPAIPTAVGRYFSLRYGHVGTLIASNCQKTVSRNGIRSLPGGHQGCRIVSGRYAIEEAGI